jgi:hypothetical protein
MDVRLRDAERRLTNDPHDSVAQLNYLSHLTRSVGECVVQLISANHATSSCSGEICNTYSTVEHVAGGGIGHDNLYSLDGFFDHLVVNNIRPDHIPFQLQESLLKICQDFCANPHSCS